MCLGVNRAIPFWEKNIRRCKKESQHAVLSERPVKGTVSPDIAFYFRFCKIKSVLSVRPLVVFNFYYFLVLQIFKYTFENCFYESTY